MNQQDTVLFVVLNFNGWQETLPCIDAILTQTYSNFHIILIDNGSHDESLKKLAKYDDHEKVTFIKNPKNLGFDGGVNIGIRHAIDNDYNYLVLLNNDAVISIDWLEILVNKIKQVDTSSITGLLLLGDGKIIESTGDSYSIWGVPFPSQRGEPTAEARDSGFIFNGTAGATLYKTSLFKDIGLFDEKFFAYFEDTDMGFQAQLAGHKTYYEKTAIAYHDHGTTSGKMPGFTVYQTFKNLPLLFWKDIPLQLIIPIGLRFVLIYWLLFIRAVLRGQFVVASKGVIKSLILTPHALRQRRKIQAKRVVSIDYLRSIIYPELPPANKRYIQKQLQRFKL